MISIKAIHSGNPFTKYPQLNEIWPPFSQAIASQTTVEALREKQDGLFLILNDKEVIGITGYFILEQNEVQKLCLRWHGIIPSERGHGYSKEVILQVLEESQKTCPGFEHISEFVPMTQYRQSIINHFKAMGFKKYGQPLQEDWRPEPLQEYRVRVDEFLNKKIKPFILKMK